MRKFNIRYNTSAKQNYTSLTIKELEELLGKETSNSKIQKTLDLILQWKRLLLGIILILILIYICGYLTGLKKEIAVLRGESAALRLDILNLQEENAGLQKKLDAKQPSESSAPEEASDTTPQETLNTIISPLFPTLFACLF
ncbi:MAG: hypothetical protein WC601_03575 [Desulfotomaculaceae bacterium]